MEQKDGIIPGQYADSDKQQRMSPNAVDAIVVDALLDTVAVRNMILSLMARLAAKGWMAPVVIGGKPDAIGEFYVYFQQIFADVTAAVKPIVDETPRFVQVVANLMGPQSPSYRVNTLKYRWNYQSDVDYDCVPLINVAGVRNHFVIGYPDPSFASDYRQPMKIATPSPGSNFVNPTFNAILGLLQDENLPDTQMVTWSMERRGLRDPSAFSRCRRILGGTADLSGAVFGVAELETPLCRSWIPACFSLGDGEMLRIPRSFRYKSGDSSLLMNLPFFPGWTMSDYNNNGAVVYKFIDFNEIYFWVVAWLQETIAQQNLSYLYDLNLLQPIPMSAQTFRLVLRQAVLQIFSEQSSVQFMTPRVSADPTDNVFVPYIVHFGTYSAPQFAQLKLPSFLVHNLQMLKAVTKSTEGRKSKLMHLPVLGSYLYDEYDYDPVNLQSVPGWGSNPERRRYIFSVSPDDESAISIVDGALDSDYVNFNSEYYQTAVAVLNSYFSNFDNVGGNLSTCQSGASAGLSLLHITKYVNPYPFFGGENKDQLTNQGVDKRTGVTHSNPGGVEGGFASAFSSSVSWSQEMVTLSTRFIVPVVRASLFAPGIQHPSQWMIAYVEPYFYQVTNADQFVTRGCSMATMIRMAASSVVTGAASGETSDELVRVMESMALAGKNVNWMQVLSAR